MEINHLRKKLLYAYIYWPVGKVIVLTRILDQLMLQIATSNGSMDWEKYPKSRKSIRMKHPKTLESKTIYTFPEMRGGTFVKHFGLWKFEIGKIWFFIFRPNHRLLQIEWTCYQNGCKGSQTSTGRYSFE